MTTLKDQFDALLRRRMSAAKVTSLYQEAEKAAMQGLLVIDNPPNGNRLAEVLLAQSMKLMAAADHIVRSELLDT